MNHQRKRSGQDEEAVAIAVAQLKKKKKKRKKEEAMIASNKQQQQQQTTTATDEGNRGPAMEVRLCGGYLSFGYGGSAREVLWWSEA